MQHRHPTVPPKQGVAASRNKLWRRGDSALSQVGVAGAYIATDQAGATPRRLRLLLYDGAIRLCRQGLAALDDGEVALAADRLARAGRIVEQLRRDLLVDGRDRRLDRFARLYEQVARRLVEAGFYRRREPLNETILLLNCRRHDWNALTRSLDEGEPAGPAAADPESWVG